MGAAGGARGARFVFVDLEFGEAVPRKFGGGVRCDDVADGGDRGGAVAVEDCAR